MSYVNKNVNGAVFAKIKMFANIVALGIVIPDDPSFMFINHSSLFVNDITVISIFVSR